MRTYKLTISYDGSRYQGWQRQATTDNTIQYILEWSIGKLVGYRVHIDGSGRTDAGVHARGQVASVKLSKLYDTKELKDSLNRYLPEDIRIVKVELAKNGFHARKSAKGKKEVCDDYIANWRHLLLNSPYFGLNHWLNEMDAENGQAIIYAKESDEITRKLSLKSSEGGYKVTIVWLPEKLHEVCANKLLKLLEEPPEKTIFLLISEAPEMILPTILSRTQRFNIPKIEEADIAEALQQKYGVQPRDSETIAHLANGDFIKALETIHLNEENELFFNLFVSLMRLSYQRKIREMKQWSEQLAAMGRERQKNFLDYCQRMTRENFIYNLHRKEMNYMTLPEQNFATRFAPFVNERNVMGIMDELSEAQRHIEQNVNARMVFFDFSLKMIVLLKQ